MKLYLKLALSNIKKNYRFYIPRIIAEAGLLLSFYISLTLALDKRLAEIKGGEYIPTLMWMAAAVLLLLSIIILIYVNNFIMKRRKKEYGLYNILGMEKKHVAKVLLFESLILSLIAIIIGLLLGMLFYKICSLLICKLLQTEIVAGFYYISAKTILLSGSIFVLIDLFNIIVNRISIARMKPVDLIHSENVGEKEPKVNILLLILGILSIGGAYYISITIKTPLQALLLFFVAVILAIIGTYFLFISGSVFVLKKLKKNKKLYYKPKNMTVISGLLYRMKQNAVGLASIAILATGVLVMISTTVSLYVGMQDVIDKNYPEDAYVSSSYYPINNEINNQMLIPDDAMEEMIYASADISELPIATLNKQKYLEVTYEKQANDFSTPDIDLNIENNLAGLYTLTFITEDTFTKLGGDKLNLNKGEVGIVPFTAENEFPYDNIIISGKYFTVAKTPSLFPIQPHMISSINCYGVVLSSEEELTEIYEAQKAAYGDAASNYDIRYSVTFASREEALVRGYDFGDSLVKMQRDYIEEILPAGQDYYLGGIDSVWNATDSVHGMYGSFLFLGFLLGGVCIFTTALIIYYKQISEGYEDRTRYQIMRKIGMSDNEIKKTINSQVLKVFFIPLIVAIVHFAFASPILIRLLKILLLPNIWLYIGVSLAVFALFSLIYVIIYKLTARSYYRIVR